MLGRAIVAALRSRVPVLPFHADWIKNTFAPGVEISALSCPRGSAKSWIVGQLASLALRPGLTYMGAGHRDPHGVRILGTIPHYVGLRPGGAGR